MFPAPGGADLSLEDPRVLLSIPRDIDAIMGQDLDLAVRWREATRAAFVHYLARGYELREFVRRGPVSDYLLVLDQDQGA